MAKYLLVLVIFFSSILFSNAGSPPDGQESPLNNEPIKILSYNVRNCKGLDK